jgi:PII-like signaling protein
MMAGLDERATAMSPPVKALLAFFDANDEWDGSPLHEELVRQLERHGIAGATVLSGIMGYGIHRRIHRKGLLGVVDDKPLTVVAIDSEEKLRGTLPIIRPMVREGLVVLIDVEVIAMQPASVTDPRS